MKILNTIVNTILWFIYVVIIVFLIYPVGEILCKSTLGTIVFAIFYVLCIVNPIVDIYIQEILKIKEGNK